MDTGPAVVGEVRAFKHRDLTLGLPHTFAIAVIYVTAMLAMYFKLWLAAALFFAFFWTLGRAGIRYDPYWWEIIRRLPSLPRILAP